MKAEYAALLRSHDDLRAALILAGREIRKLNLGHKDSPMLVKLRQVLREARTARRAVTASHRAAWAPKAGTGSRILIRWWEGLLSTGTVPTSGRDRPFL